MYTCRFVFLLGIMSIALSLFGQNYTIILGRPTDNSVTANILFQSKANFYLEYGSTAGNYPSKTETFSNTLGSPDEIDMTNLLSNTRYFYRLRFKSPSESQFQTSPEYQFMTQRQSGHAFVFTLEADEHLYDKKGYRELYEITLQNQAKDKPDFMISLGDIFGDDHTPNETTSEDMDLLHKDYLQYLGKICHSIPFYVCLGNHEGENGYYLKQTPPYNIAHYGTYWRKLYYPNPYPNAFYSGNMMAEGNGLGLPENFYAWTWGDALFVILDVYRHCDINEKPQNWDWTLGKDQYDWFKKTLEESKVKHKFVFAHHTRGQGRGGVLTAKGFEWGGYTNSKYQFDEKRPGWGKPIHQLMVDNGVDIFFQGHDHLYAKEALDGLVYQEVPMPSDSSYSLGIIANGDAYSDVTLPGSGHLRVSVDDDCVTVDFIKAFLPKDTASGQNKNGEIAHSYTVGKCTSSNNEWHDSFVKISPNPMNDFFHISGLDQGSTSGVIYNYLGNEVLRFNSNHVDVSAISPGTYIVALRQTSGMIYEKISIMH